MAECASLIYLGVIACDQQIRSASQFVWLGEKPLVLGFGIRQNSFCRETTSGNSTTGKSTFGKVHYGVHWFFRRFKAICQRTKFAFGLRTISSTIRLSSRIQGVGRDEQPPCFCHQLLSLPSSDSNQSQLSWETDWVSPLRSAFLGHRP